MKGIILTIALCCTLQLQLVSAQSAEVTQLLLNVEKLSQLKQILADMKNGYRIVSRGYSKIRDITQGNFQLHELFLAGLLEVNPNLRKYARVPAIIACQRDILEEYKAAYNRFRRGGRFTAGELDYLSTAYGNLLDRSLRSLDELTMVLTASELRMNDSERLSLIDRIYADIIKMRSVLRVFNKKVAGLEQTRQRAEQENNLLQGIYGQ